MDKSPAQAQLERELGDRLSPFVVLEVVDPPRAVNCSKAMARLRGKQTAPLAYREVMLALWGNDRPERTNPEWWWTPLGLFMAEVGSRIGAAGSMTQPEAAAVLGVNFPTVSSYVRRKFLPATSAGQPLTSAVLARLVRQGGPSRVSHKAVAS